MTRTTWTRLSHSFRASARAFNALFGRRQSSGLSTRWAASPTAHELRLVEKVLRRESCDVALADKVCAMLSQTPGGDMARASMPRRLAALRKAEAVLWVG